MLAFIPALLGGLAMVMASLVGRVLLALGISYVTFSGVSVGINTITDGIKSNMQNMGAEAVQFLSYMWVDKALAMMFSAWVASMALRMAGSSTIKKMMVK